MITGERFGIAPSDLAEARSENRLPRKNLIRDSGELVEVRDGLDLPALANYGPQPELADELRSFVAWLEENYE